MLLVSFSLLFPIKVESQVIDFVIPYRPLGVAFASPTVLVAILPLVGDKPLKRQYRVSGGNCVTVVRQAGFVVPQNPRILAKYLPIQTTKMPLEGKKVVVVTYESSSGHVAVIQNIGGKLISVVDSAGVGRVIDPSVVKGYL